MSEKPVETLGITAKINNNIRTRLGLTRERPVSTSGHWEEIQPVCGSANHTIPLRRTITDSPFSFFFFFSMNFVVPLNLQFRERFQRKLNVIFPAVSDANVGIVGMIEVQPCGGAFELKEL